MAKLIIVTGFPATGKTTIAGYLSEKLALPLFAKDVYKELLFDQIGVKDRAWSRLLGRASFEILFRELEECLKHDISLIVEANFRSEMHDERMSALIKAYAPMVVQVLCRAKGEVLIERFEARIKQGRHVGHNDQVTLEELRPLFLHGVAEPLNIGGELIEVETTDWDSVDFTSLANQIK